MKWTAAYLVVLAILGNFCDAQFSPLGDSPQQQQGKPGPYPAPYPQKGPSQIKQIYEKPLKWTYPTDPTLPPRTEVPFVIVKPISAVTVAVECRERDIHVEVKKDFFGTGQLINKDDLTLGTCTGWEDTVNQVIIFESDLHNCGSTLQMLPDLFVYTFTLNYLPQPLGNSNVVRTPKAAVTAECHYIRNHNVSTGPIQPQWIPYADSVISQEFLYFTLSLMTHDWQNVRPSPTYYLGDVINIQASVRQYFHQPLLVFVSYCVATLVPDASSIPRYVFLCCDGCFVDAKITGSGSMFVARPENNRIQFQLDSFRFIDMNADEIYLTCELKARPAQFGMSDTHKACSFINNRWEELSGQDNVCGMCDTIGPETAGTTGTGTTGGKYITTGTTGTGTTGGKYTTGTATSPVWAKQQWGTRKTRALPEIAEWEGVVQMGPLVVKEKTA